MSVTLSPVGGVAQQFFDNNGQPLSGGKIYTYASGTTTPQATYTSATGTTPHSNPIILDSAGRVPGGEIWLSNNLQYKFVIYTSLDILIGTYDNIIGINSNFVNFEAQNEFATATAGQTVFTLSTINYTPGTNTLNVFIDGVKQYVGTSYVETNSTTVTFTSGLHVGAQVEFTTAITLSAGVTTANLVTYTAGFTGAVAQTVQTKLEQYISVADFGAVGDGTTDDTAAFLAAIAATPDGGVLYLPPNATYLIAQTIVLTKPIVIRGGAKENTTLLFKASGTYLAAPYKCGILAPHSTTVVPSYSGDAARSSFSGFTLQMQAGPSAMTGMLVCTPVYINEVDAVSFSGHGFAVNASVAPTVDIIGNANGATFTNCAAITNTLSGFYTYGNNANACVFLGCRTFQNTLWGFYEDGFLGNSYVGCETDGNVAGGYGGYATIGSGQNRSCYVGCYAETNQTPTWSVGVYTTRIGAQNAPGASGALTGLSLSAIPNGEFYFNQPLNFAATDQIAQDQAGGVYTRLNKSGLKAYLNNGGKVWELSGALSTNYTDILVNSTPVFRFPNNFVSDNLTLGRPYAPNGLSFGTKSAIVGSGSAAPTTGTYYQGAIQLNDSPVASGYVGWVCVVGGSPGTWKTFGAIST